MNKKTQLFLIVVLAIVAIFLAFVISVKPKESGEISGPTLSPTDISSVTISPENSDETPTIESTPTNIPTPTPVPTPAPTEIPANKPLSNLVICIDAGHQGQQNSEKEPLAPWEPSRNATVNNTVLKAKCTSGTSGRYSKVDEYIVTLQISLKLQEKLEALGAKVVMVRTDHNVNLSNIDRANIANDANADLCIRIHCNGAENESASGVETYTRGDGDNSSQYKDLAKTDKALATEMLKYICEATGAKNRGAKVSDNYTGINWCQVPCIILETGFMSNETEDLKLVRDDYQNTIASSIAKWLLETKLLNK